MADSAPGASRRAVVAGIAGLGVATPLLAACGSSSSASGSSGSGGSGSSGSSSGSGSTGGGTSAKGLTKTTDIPVGSGKIFPSKQVVVTQPTQGDFKAFSAVCPHQGCIVAEVRGADIDCACHGSRFSIKDGSVLNGPATSGLQKMTATVKGGEITVS